MLKGVCELPKWRYQVGSWIYDFGVLGLDRPGLTGSHHYIIRIWSNGMERMYLQGGPSLYPGTELLEDDMGKRGIKGGLPWWRSGWESACQCRGHGFEPWSGKIPHAARRAARPVSHNYWACAFGACAPQQERPRQWEACAPQWGVAPTCHN